MICRAALDLIRESEGLRLNAYRDAAGIWTIGYGSTKGVKPGLRITLSEANNRLSDDVAVAEGCVRKHVKVPLNENQRGALVSLVYNIGCGAFYLSTLRRRLNAGHYDQAAVEMERWVFSKGKKLPGLVTRRKAERALFEQRISEGK